MNPTTHALVVKEMSVREIVEQNADASIVCTKVAALIGASVRIDKDPRFGTILAVSVGFHNAESFDELAQGFLTAIDNF